MTIKLTRIILAMLISLFISGRSFANTLAKDLNTFFDAAGYVHQSNDPSSYHDQQLGYYTGGSLSARRPVRQYQLAQIQFPSLSTGCNGIDLFTGSFSVISGKELEHVAKDIISSASTYAFNLAIESMSPLIADVMEKLHSRMDMINQFSINSCSMSAALVGGVWPRMQATQGQLCQDIGTATPNVFSDWADARQGCGPRNEMQKAFKMMPKNKGYDDRSIHGNLAWKALSKSAYAHQDNALKELLMSVSGTSVIRINANNTVNQETYPSLIMSSDMINALLHGGTVEQYHCDETTQCLSLESVKTTIPADKSLVARVSEEIDLIQSAITNDTIILPRELDFINSTPIPIVRIITIDLAEHHQHTLVDVRQFSEIIALSIVLQYLNESLSVVNQAARQLPVDVSVNASFYEGVDHAFKALHQEQARLHRDMNILTHIVDSTRVKEKLLAGRLATHMESILR